MSDIKHISEQQLLMSVVDESALSAEVVEHLAGCPECRAKKQELEQELTGFGDAARRYCPAPVQRIEVFRETKKRTPPLFGWKPAFAAAAVAAMVLFVVFFGLIDSPVQKAPGEKNFAMTGQDAEAFMTEIYELAQNTLPRKYLFLAGESYQEWDEMDAFDRESGSETFAEVYELAENSLPLEYLFLAGESYQGWDDDVFDFLVPLINNKSITLGEKMKGVLA